MLGKIAGEGGWEMVKTVRSKLDLEQLRALLVEHARKLPDYERVSGDGIDPRFYSESLTMEIKSESGKCRRCKGSGKDGNGEMKIPIVFNDGTLREGETVVNDYLSILTVVSSPI